MEIVYTDYAEETLLERGINKRDVEETILNPEKFDAGKKGRRIANKIFGDKLLRVIFEPDVQRLIKS